MAINNKIILILFIAVSFGTIAGASEPEFPKIGLLYISGLDCDQNRETEEVPEESIQYYLTSESFYKLMVTDNSVKSIVLPYPNIDWIQVINNLPNKPPGCSTAIAIHDSSLSVAKLTMKRYKINVGEIHETKEFYYWGN